MARLKEYNGHYCESEYEYAFIGFLEAEGWIYSSGNNISRVTKRDVLIADDFKKFIVDTNPDLTEDEVTQIFDNVRLVGSESDFATLHKVYGWMVDGMQFTPQDGIARMIPLIDFKKDSNRNIFRVVNQFTVEYTNNGQKENRRPDVLLFVNGMPLCVIELKNPADANATIYDAWEQINIRYWRDIPHLLHYCPLACISDGVKTRLGTVRTPYEHFYAWRRVNDGDAVSTLPFEETETMIKGVYAPDRFLEIFRDYIYFQDSIYDSDEVEIVCRYPQFFAARLLRQSIINSVVQKSGKGGTYFGATGCGKTYTMAFLARQLALRCTDIPEIGSPTIILIVDRDELQKQGAKLFTKSKEFLNLGEVAVVKNRAQLRQELGARQSGGFYICTIQKFCDREDDKIGLINDRQNIICFSDEAHRTQLEHSKKIQFSKDADENMKAMVSKPYAKVLKEAFPQATFVGFTGTPIAETYQTFGDEIDRYTMDQAVADGLTVSIKYHPRIAKVLLDKVKVKEIEDYYKKCADDGATYEDIEASKKAMSSMEVILGEPSRLERLARKVVEAGNLETKLRNNEEQTIENEEQIKYIKKHSSFIKKIFILFHWGKLGKLVAEKEDNIEMLILEHGSIKQNLDEKEKEIEETEKKIEIQQEDVLETEKKVFELERTVYGENNSLKEKYKDNLADREFYTKIKESEKSQNSCPWTFEEYDKAREELFYAALQVRKAFILESPYIKRNLFVYEAYNNGRYTLEEKKEMFPHLFNALSIVIPVLSSTFAAVGRFLKHAGNESLGMLVVDEAGQAIPQSALGAIYRTKQAIIVGDPLQVEPVVTIPRVLIDILADSVGVESKYKVIENSVQTFADCINEFNGMIGERQVGCPLVVHRRCIEPMFSISNMISYDNRMFNMTNKKEEYLKEEQPFLLKKSGWIDVVGPENGRKNHFVKNQAEKVCQLLEQAVEIYDNLFERDECIFIITPFRTVAESMRSFVNDYFRNKGYDRDCLISWTKKCIGTVHTFQGKGANEVLFVLGCSKMSVGAMNWVVKKANILNVAVTRAKYRIGFIGDMQDWKKLKYFREFIPYLIDEIQVDDSSCLFTS